MQMQFLGRQKKYPVGSKTQKLKTTKYRAVGRYENLEVVKQWAYSSKPGNAISFWVRNWELKTRALNPDLKIQYCWAKEQYATNWEKSSKPRFDCWALEN